MLAMGMYLEKHSEKKWHDPTAAACHLHPEIGTWFRGRVRRVEAGWGTVPDPEGECALSVNFLFPDIEQSKRFARALSAEGVRVGTVHNEGFPDRHIYRYWDYVLNKVPVTPANDPWRHPAYKGNVEYSPDMCPQTISVLTRTVAVSLNPRMTARHSKMIARAIRKVAEAL